LFKAVHLEGESLDENLGVPLRLKVPFQFPLRLQTCKRGEVE
jgi:hypothetical protein